MESGNVKTETAVRELFTPHSSQDKADLADRLAEASGRKQRYTEALATATKTLKEKIKAANEEVTEAVLMIAAEGDMAPVEVECRWDYGTNTYTEQRKDSGEIIKQRAITAEERQEGLDLKPAESEAA